MIKKLAFNIILLSSSFLVSPPANALPEIVLVNTNTETETFTYVDANSVENINGKASAIIYFVPFSNNQNLEITLLMEFDCKNRTSQNISTYIRDRLFYNEWRKSLKSKTQKIISDSPGEKLFNYLCKK